MQNSDPGKRKELIKSKPWLWLLITWLVLLTSAPIFRLFYPKVTWLTFSSVAQSCPTLCNPMNHSTPGLFVCHQFPESTQTHVCWVGDAIQPSHPISSPSPPAHNLSQHQGLFQWVSSSHEMAKVLEFQSFRMDRLDILAVQGTLKSLLQHHSS